MVLTEVHRDISACDVQGVLWSIGCQQRISLDELGRCNGVGRGILRQ